MMRRTLSVDWGDVGKSVVVTKLDCGHEILERYTRRVSFVEQRGRLRKCEQCELERGKP